MQHERLTNTLRRELDARTVDEVRVMYGPGKVTTTYAGPVGYHWRPGDGAPPLIAESPAVAQAMGRCVASRVRYGAEVFGEVHPKDCGWCAYDLDTLLTSLDHAAFMSRAVAVETETWLFVDSNGLVDAYVRSTNRSGEYDNPVWREFYAISAEARRRAIAQAAG